jgi:hypothetical protein
MGRQKTMMRRLGICLALAYVPIMPAVAEPYLAVRSGGQCMMCHTNPTGGGKRNEYGNVYAQRNLAARYVDGQPAARETSAGWSGAINQYLAVGADMRTELRFTDVPNQDSSSEFIHEESLLYLELRPVPGRLTLYLDERLGPGGATTREAYGLFWIQPSRFYLKAGQFFLPYGLRLEDDEAFIRSVTGINFDTPDEGAEFGFEQGRWSGQLAVTNGGTQTDDKRSSLNAVYTQPRWRAGGSFNHNETDLNEREMLSVYGGLQTGPISWLLEYDQVRDTVVASGVQSDQEISLIEGNWLVSPGNNLKVTYEYLDPNTDVDEDGRNRWSLVWEHFPIQYLQLSLGLRSHDAPDADEFGNRDVAFAHLHFFF